jgi:hypothetical protein
MSTMRALTMLLCTTLKQLKVGSLVVSCFHNHSQGSLQIRQSSMTTLAAFAKLSSVSNGDGLISVAGGLYAVAIYGMSDFQVNISFIDVLDNPVLLDIGNILRMQLLARHGTYVTSNALLCMQPAIKWARRNDSVVEHSLAQVR